MDIRKVRALIELVQESGVAELEIKQGEETVRISRVPQGTVSLNAPLSTLASIPSPVPVSSAPVELPKSETATPPPSKPSGHIVRSPMVGTFYRAPAPEAPAYVEIGSTVRKGQTLCILEAMKLMNELESEVDGVVRQIKAENADPVEYGQVLFLIEPDNA